MLSALLPRENATSFVSILVSVDVLSFERIRLGCHTGNNGLHESARTRTCCIGMTTAEAAHPAVATHRHRVRENLDVQM